MKCRIVKHKSANYPNRYIKRRSVLINKLNYDQEVRSLFLKEIVERITDEFIEVFYTEQMKSGTFRNLSYFYGRQKINVDTLITGIQSQLRFYHIKSEDITCEVEYDKDGNLRVFTKFYYEVNE